MRQNLAGEPQTLQQVAELAAAAAITDTSTTQISETQGKQWQDEVMKYAEDQRFFLQAIQENNTLVGKGDSVLTVMKSTSALAVDSSPAGGEGDVRDNTELTNLDTVDITPTFKRGKVSISKQLVMTSRLDLIAQAKYVIANALSRDVDQAIATALQAATVTTNRLWGGDATGVDSLATGDVLTTDLIADAAVLNKKNNFVPYAFFMAAEQEGTLRKDSQFTNAAEYGGNEVILKGEIGNYLGIKIIVTTNTPTYASGATDTNETPTTWGAAGHACIMLAKNHMGQKSAATLAWKEKPHIDYEYEKDEAIHKIYYDQAYAASLIEEGAMCLVKVTDA
jgi:N4-gp56 family major capsid protein